MDYLLKRTRRKTVGIYILQDGTVEVRAPLRVPKKQIDAFVQKKQEWILEKSGEKKAAQARRQQFSVHPGDVLELAGILYCVELGESLKLSDRVLTIPDRPFAQWRGDLETLLQAEAERLLKERAAYFSVRMGVIPSRIRVGRANAYWGTCTGKNSVNFTWKLIFAPADVIDYVVVHELAHIREHNHSPRFWSIVESVLPDWKQRRKKLKPLQQKLAAEAWG